MIFDTRQTATLLAALQHWNHSMETHGVGAIGGGYFDNITPLDENEVNSLYDVVKSGKDTVILVDQSSIPASFGEVSLFVNGSAILDVGVESSLPITDVATSLANALDVELRTVSLSELQLAQYLADINGKRKELDDLIDAGETDLDDWVQGYNNEDVMGAINALYPNE